MDYTKPVIKEKDLKLYESFNQQYLSSFPDKAIGIPKMAWETCDNHLTLKQPIMFVDPKGNPVSEISWVEPIDVSFYWSSRLRPLWFGIFVASLFFFIVIYRGWGVLIG